eukprot:721203-Pyramimonas_sp.AAC.2
MAMRRAASTFGNQLRSQTGIKNVSQGFVESTGATGEGFPQRAMRKYILKSDESFEHGRRHTVRL